MISGLVIHLHEDERLAAAAVEAIAADGAFELGERCGRRLPVALDADSGSASQQATDWLWSLGGVVHVDVAFVHLEEELEEAVSKPLRKGTGTFCSEELRKMSQSPTVMKRIVENNEVDHGRR